MIKAIIFDADGVVISSKMFTDELEKEFGIGPEKVKPFFQTRFKHCVIGKADLKEELKPFLKEWGWQGSVDELTDYWFKAEHEFHDEVVQAVKRLRAKGIKCYVATNQEKYRAEYLRTCMGFDELFDGVWVSGELGVKKPDQAFFQMMYDEINQDVSLAKDEIMFWDDGVENVEGAKAFGFDAYFYKSFDEFEHLLKQVGML